MRRKIGLIDKVIKGLTSFTVSYAFVIITYVLISNIGIFHPIDNKMALELMYVCLVIAAIHFAIGFLDIKSSLGFFLIDFGVVVAVVLFMGTVVFDFFIINNTFFVYLAGMLVVVFAGTYFVAYFDNWKKAQEINEIIEQNKK